MIPTHTQSEQSSDSITINRDEFQKMLEMYIEKKYVEKVQNPKYHG